MFLAATAALEVQMLVCLYVCLCFILAVAVLQLTMTTWTTGPK